MKRYPIAVAIADLHLSLLRPACRADNDWMTVQAGYLNQVIDIAKELPIFCAGDLFDRPNASPELINFALSHLPDGMLSIPGQHDLPNHRMDEEHRSGYGVLCRARKIRNIASSRAENMGDCIAAPHLGTSLVRIALIHRYCWIKGKGFPGAPASANATKFKKELGRYNVAVFGDNHIPFIAKAGDCTILNCGTFIRRKSDEIPLSPGVGIIYSDGTVKRRLLDTSGDRFHEDAKKREEMPFDMKAFLEGLEKLGEHGLDFRLAVKQHLESEDVDPRTKEIILKAIE